jgi:competence protein ComEA
MTFLVALAMMLDVPAGAGKEATVKACSDCHSIEQAVSLRQGKQAWTDTVQKMLGMGAKIPDDSVDAVVQYLARHFGADAPIQIHVNTASAVDLESLFLLKRAEAAAVIQYRGEHGDFKSLDDLRKVPGVDFTKIEAKKDLIVF